MYRFYTLTGYLKTLNTISFTIFNQSHFKGTEVDPYQVKDITDKLWNEFGIPMWVTEFTWERIHTDDPNHEIHAIQLEKYYR